MIRTIAAFVACLTATAPASAADLGALCKGWEGSWHQVDDSTLGKDGKWKPDLSNPDWTVKSLGSGRCRFLFAKSSGDDFIIDTSPGTYDFISLKGGKPAPAEHNRFVTTAIESPTSWSVTVEMVRRTKAAPYGRLVMTMAGDLFDIAYFSTPKSGAPYMPRGVTVHRRVH